MAAILQTTFSTSNETVLISSNTSLQSISMIQLTKIHHCLEPWCVITRNLRINAPDLNRMISSGPSDAVKT